MQNIVFFVKPSVKAITSHQKHVSEFPSQAPPTNLSVFWLLVVLLFLCFSDSSKFSSEQHFVMAGTGRKVTDCSYPQP